MGRGGARPGAGRKPSLSVLEAARAQLRTIQRGIAGDLDRSMPQAERERIAEDRMVEYIHEMMKGRWPEVLAMYWSALEAHAQAAAKVPDAGESGSRLLDALDHFGGADVPVTSQSQGCDLPAPVAARSSSESATESESVVPSHELPRAPIVVQGSLLDEAPAAGRGDQGRGGPPTPPRPTPSPYAVGAEIFEKTDRPDGG